MTPRLKETLDYIKGLIRHGKPFQAVLASEALGISVEAVSDRLKDLRRAGLIRCSYRRIGFTVASISIDGLGSTPWPNERMTVSRGKMRTPKKHELSAEEIAARRAETERAHAERQQWLAREFKGRGKGPTPSSFDPYAAAVARAYRMHRVSSRSAASVQ